MPKVAFISDIHGNYEALQAVLANIRSRAINRIICLGDVASYNADQDACIRFLVENQIEWVAGNHDLIAAGMLQPLGCSPSAFYAAMQARRRLSAKWIPYIRRLPLMLIEHEFMAFHASPYRVDEYLTTEWRFLQAASFIQQHQLPQVAFFGHTHTNSIVLIENGSASRSQHDQATLEYGKTYLINVGSVGEPRDGDLRAAYAEFDSDTRMIQFHRVGYDYNASHVKSNHGHWRMPHGYTTRLLTVARLSSLRLRHKVFPMPLDDSSIEAVRLRMNPSDEHFPPSLK